MHVVRIDMPPRAIGNSSFADPAPPCVGDVGAVVDVVDDGQGGIGYVVESVVEDGEHRGSTRWVAVFSAAELRASGDLPTVLYRTPEA
ncbi:hypothetical protein [Burkholderia ubonensis]|uniref:hypothetical protein n=1 Tax=Burkholderia ubonensis TaxID=101571 RepID=UPI001E3EEDC7|nr:hypothetical protein [Burkholderia ubonensis]